MSAFVCRTREWGTRVDWFAHKERGEIELIAKYGRRAYALRDHQHPPQDPFQNHLEEVASGVLLRTFSKCA